MTNQSNSTQDTVLECVAKAIREEQVRQYRDNERNQCPGGAAFYEEEVAPYKLAQVALEASDRQSLSDRIDVRDALLQRACWLMRPYCGGDEALRIFCDARAALHQEGKTK